MGLNSRGSYATVWEVKSVKDNKTEGRISVSRKRKDTGEYVNDFSGFVSFVGTAAAMKALKLKEGDRIYIKDWELTNAYNKEKNVTYWNVAVFSFETAEEHGGGKSTSAPTYNPVDGSDNEPEDNAAALPF